MRQEQIPLKEIHGYHSGGFGDYAFFPDRSMDDASRPTVNGRKDRMRFSCLIRDHAVLISARKVTGLFFAVVFGLAFSVTASPLTHPALMHVKVEAAPAHAPLELVKDGAVKFVILSDTTIEKDMTYAKASRRCITPAVQTLKRYVEEATDGKVETADVRDAARHAGKLQFLVGESSLTRALGLFADRQAREGYTLATFPGGVAIVGNDSSLMPDYYREPQRLWRRGERKATVFGVYDFLERFFGCRFYYPGPEGRIVPKVANLTLAPCRYSDAPHIHCRGGCYMNWNWKETQKTLQCAFPYGEMEDFHCAIRWGDSDPFPTAHSPHPEPYAQANPQDIATCYFKNRQGHRYQSVTSHPANYFDITNLKTADCFVESLKRFFASGGKDEQGWRCVSGYRIPIGQCDCERPLAEMQENETVRKLGLITDENLKLGQNGWYADVYGRFNQYIANRIKREFPGQRVTFIGYNNYTWPPRQAKYRPLPDNVDVSLAFRDMPRFYRNAKKRAECVALLKDWRDWLGGYPVQGLWCYNGGNSCFAHAVANGYLGEMIRGFGDDLGRISVFPEFQMHGNPLSGKYISQLLFYYQTYAGMRMLWDPAFDHHAAYDELWRLMYGPEAAVRLKALYGTLEEAFETYALPKADEKAVYPMSVLNKIASELDAVEKIVKDDPVRMRRFRLIALPLRAELAIQRLQLATALPVALVPRADAAGTWMSAPCVPFVDPHGSGKAPPVSPALRLAWTDTALKGVLETDFRPETGRDFWNGDVVELFLSPGERKDWYAQICFNPAGEVFSQCRKLLPIPGPSEGEWKPAGMTHDVERTVKGWRLTFEIPFASLGRAKRPTPYGRWKFACVYNSSRPRGPAGMSATSVLLMQNHNPDRWGYLRFLGAGDVVPARAPEKQHVTLSGGAVPYSFNLTRDMKFCLDDPRYSFGFGWQGSDFFNLCADGLWLSNAHHDGTPFSVTPTAAGGTRATRDVNIDGRRFRLGFETRPDSPLLFVSVKPLAGGTACRHATVRISCVPSVMEGQQGYRNVAYARYAETARGRRAAGALAPDDRFVLIGDDHYDGSGERKGFGPCYFELPSDWSGLKGVTLDCGNHYHAHVDFDLDPAGPGVTLAIHQPMSAMTREQILGVVVH